MQWVGLGGLGVSSGFPDAKSKGFRGFPGVSGGFLELKVSSVRPRVWSFLQIIVSGIRENPVEQHLIIILKRASGWRERRQRTSGKGGRGVIGWVPSPSRILERLVFRVPRDIAVSNYLMYFWHKQTSLAQVRVSLRKELARSEGLHAQVCL